MKYYYEKWSYATFYSNPDPDWYHYANGGGNPTLILIGSYSPPKFNEKRGFFFEGYSGSIKIDKNHPVGYELHGSAEARKVVYSRDSAEMVGVEAEYYKKTASYRRAANKLIDTVIAENGAYPDNGISGGYYWIKKGAYIVPPVISGQDAELGQITKEYTLNYTVTHESGCMVTEQIDGKTLRMYSCTSASTNTLAVSAAVWKLLSNGLHRLTITAVAKNSANAIAIRNYTFVKKEMICFTLLEPIKNKTKVSCITVRLLGNLSKARVTVSASNNAEDEEPVWEDITTNVLSETEYFFKNTIGSPGLNFKVEIQGEPQEGIYVSGIELKYKEGKDGI